MLFTGWVNELVGGQHSGAKGFMFFGVNVDLTESGIGTLSLLFLYHALNVTNNSGTLAVLFVDYLRNERMTV